MSKINLKQVKAIEQKNKSKILSCCKNIPDTSGIYVLTRTENNLKYAYIGQAKRLLTRLASHLNGYQYIDLSLRKHGLFSEENPCGWKIQFYLFNESILDLKEQKFIRNYANAGYQLRNKTAGGQSDGKVIIDEIKPAKGYRDGLNQGYKNAQKYVANLFEKNLYFSHKGKVEPTKNQLKAIQKFENFLKINEE